MPNLHPPPVVIPASRIFQDLTMVVDIHVSGLWWRRVRIRAGLWVIKLGARVAGLGLRVNRTYEDPHS